MKTTILFINLPNGVSPVLVFASKSAPFCTSNSNMSSCSRQTLNFTL